MPRLAAQHARRAASHVLYILLLWHAIVLDFTIKIIEAKRNRLISEYFQNL